MAPRRSSSLQNDEHNLAENSERFTEQWNAVDPFDPDYPHLWVKAEHLGRYLFAANYLAEQGVSHVADAGCGTGYGSAELAKIADRVTSLDSDPRSLDATRSRTSSGSIETVQSDLTRASLQENLPGIKFDGIVCFETLEHVIDPGSTLAAFHALLSRDGTLIISVPNGVAEGVDRVGLLTNPFHRRVYSISSITELVQASGFDVIEVLGQPIAAEISRNETRLIRRKQVDGRIGDEPSLHAPETVRRLALSTAYPEPRDVERSYSIIIVARRRSTLSG
jgi:2-polyprenyl-3-methyl-5-hydroxy-6-metoxy-1,4-benzoquinol methylase